MGVDKRIIMLHTHYAIYLFELFQVEGETGRSSAETTGSELSSDEIATELKRLEISSRGGDDETFLSPDTGSLVSSMSDEAPTIMQEPQKVERIPGFEEHPTNNSALDGKG